MACVLCSGSERVQNAAGCGHAYCAGCVARELLRGRFACAVCKAPLSRAAFGQGGDGAAARGAAAAASSLAREMKARRRLAKILNRERGDYENDEAFYQYQEWAEDLAYRVVRGEDCERELADYKAANQAAIVARNQENEAREREAREAELREAAERAAAAAAREAAERREAAGRRKERERALSLVAQGQLGAAETARRVEAQVGKRRRRDEEQAQEQLEQQRAKAEPADRCPPPSLLLVLCQCHGSFVSLLGPCVSSLSPLPSSCQEARGAAAAAGGGAADGGGAAQHRQLVRRTAAPRRFAGALPPHPGRLARPRRRPRPRPPRGRPRCRAGCRQAAWQMRAAVRRISDGLREWDRAIGFGNDSSSVSARWWLE